MRVRVIDLDGSVAAQGPLAALAAEGLARVIDMRKDAPGMRIIARRSAIHAFSDALNTAFLPGRGPEVTFYGSGDFHHLTAALVARHDGPLTLVHVDNHPDWVRFPATFNCGAWVNRALELPQVRKVVTIGPCSGDLKWPQFKGANLAAIRSGQLTLFPWQAAPSRALGHPGGHIHWRNLAVESYDGFLDSLTEEIPTRAVYLTIDKDALTHEDAITNWDQGQMRLAHVEALVTWLAQNHQIVGADICGDYSTPLFSDVFRATLAWFDHPGAQEHADDALAVNARTNAALLNVFRRVL